jgi:hypothetical protein
MLQELANLRPLVKVFPETLINEVLCLLTHLRETCTKDEGFVNDSIIDGFPGVASEGWHATE